MQRSFEELATRYQHRIMTYASYHLGNRDEALDVTQEVLVKLWRHGLDIDPDGLWPWLVRVTRNASIDALRRRNVQRSHLEPDPETLESIASKEPSPAARIETADFQERLQRALADLREPYRSILILREVQGLKYDEISEALELPLNTVKVYLHRGRRKLRLSLQEFANHERA